MPGFTKDHKIAILGVLTGGLIAIIIPLWQTYWVETPNLNIEIISIERYIDKKETIQIPNDLNELIADIYFSKKKSIAFPILRDDNSEDYNDNIKNNHFSIEQINNFIEITKNHLESLPSQISDLDNRLNIIKETQPFELSERKVRNTSLTYFYTKLENDTHAIEYSREEKNQNYFNNLKVDIISHIENELKDTIELQKEANANFERLERDIHNFISETQNKNSRYIITTSITNSGNASVSLKKPALFRIFIGSGNYVDLKLEIPSESYKDVAQINERASKLITFSSKKLSELQLEDRKLINQYWGKNVTGVIFTIDSLSNVEESSPTPFSDALYQKQIYDRLIFEASKLQ